LALLEGCKHELEITIPAAAVAEETEKATKSIQEKAKLPGFRPGKAPLSIIKRNFAGDIRQKVLEKLVPKFFHETAEHENLRVVSGPAILTAAAQQAVRQWRFKPYMQNGEPVETKATITVNFSIRISDDAAAKIS